MIIKQLGQEVEQVTERLTETYPCDLCNVEFCYRQCYKMGLWAEKAKEKLAEYETAEKDGRLVVLPCGTVYFIHNKAIRTKSILDLLLWEIDGIDKGGEHWSTREKAEKALKEMEEKQSE